MRCLRSSKQLHQNFLTMLSTRVSSALFFSKALCMNKTELIEHIAKQADISKAAAGRALEATIGAVRTTLKKF